MTNAWRDVRYGMRMLWKSRGFLAVAVATLALGIGANTAIFSVINAILLKPLPYDQADRLVFLTEWSEEVPEMSFSVANLKDVRDRNTVFESLVGYNGQNFILTGQGGEAERVAGRQVTSGLFSTLRKQPILGRAFTAEEDTPGAERVVLLSEGFWERRFGRDPKVLGQTLNLSGETFTVIGVMPRTVHGGWKNQDVFTPLLRLEEKIGGEKQRGNHPGIYVVARLKSGVSVEQARTEVKSIAAQLADEHPDHNARQSMTVEPLLASFVGDLRPALFLLVGAVALVLLIACANMANLLLARAASRHKEIAVRMALGARRSELVRQLLTESVLLSILGGLFGILLAYAGVRGLVASLPANVPRADEIGIDAPVLAFTAVVAILTGLLFGIAPAWKLAAGDLNDPLKEGGRGTIGAGHHRLRNLLVVAEVSLSLVLLVGAGLLLRSFYQVMQADAGFKPEGVLVASVPLPQTRFPDHDQRAAFLERLLEKAQAVPGATVVGATIPLLGGWQSSFSVEGRPEAAPGQMPSADIARVSAGYFDAMGVVLQQGRVFTEHDRKDAPRVCMIDETFAKKYWPTEEALGKRVKFGRLSDADSPWMEVVGVVKHVKNYGVDEESRVEMYLPFLQNSASSLTILVRTAGSPASLAPALRLAVKAADAEVPMFQVRPLTELVAERTAQRRLSVILISVFGALALLLAAVGIYGVMSYAVTQQTQEIGIRMALGAERDHILKMVLRHGGMLAALGIGIGLLVSFGMARAISALLFHTSATDPPTFSVVPLVLVAVALLACYLPARRATRVDPMVALRGE